MARRHQSGGIGRGLAAILPEAEAAMPASFASSRSR